MDRLGRFNSLGSKYHATPLATKPGNRRARASTTTEVTRTTNEIDLDEFYGWKQPQERCPRRDTDEVKAWRHQTSRSSECMEEAWGHQASRTSEYMEEEWLRIPLEPEESAPGYSETNTSQQDYNRNFLHPPTPDLTSSCGPTEQQNQTDGSDKARLRRRSTKNMAVVMDLDKSSRFGWWTPILLLLTMLVVMFTALYSNGSVKNLMQNKFFTTSSANAILILRVLTEACALLLAALVVVVAEDLQWALASRPGGVSLLHFVGLDGGTGVWGLVRLLATAEWREKYSSLFRLMVICTIPLPGIILMGDITLEFVFFPENTYPVAAGIGQFNSSLIHEVEDNILTALLISMGSASWSSKDTWSVHPLGSEHGLCTVSKQDSSYAPCAESHILTGGVLGISPQLDDLTTFPRSTAYVVPRTRTLQLEYGGVHDIEKLYNEGECYTIGTTYAAAYWCTATGSDQELLFGSSYCPLAIQSKGECLSSTNWTSPLQIASSLFVFKRYATVNYDRGNSSIISIADLSKPERQIIELDDYMTAISAVVPGFRPVNENGNGTEASNATVKGDNSALAIYAVTALPLNDNQIAKAMSLAAVRKAMSVPLNYFHANYFSSESVFELTRPRSHLSADMYTSLSLAISSHQVVAGAFSRWAFGALCGILLGLSATAIVITALICERRPQRCGYPTLDFAAICVAKGGIQRPPSDPEDGERDRWAGGSGLHRSLTAIGEKPGPFQVASRIKGEKVMLG
ncbi:unnamed protein product [Discula destructiva]